MGNNILFVFNTYPGIGGLESVSNNIIEYLGKYYSIYTLSVNTQANVSVPSSITEMFKFSSINDQDENINLFNRIIKEKGISYVINQGIYPQITDIIFNIYRDPNVKVFSVLHGMPGYEKIQYWQLPNIIKANKWKQKKRRFMSHLGLNRKYTKYTNLFFNSYRKACINGEKIILLCNDYIVPFIERYKLNEYQDKVIAIENPLSATFSKQDDIDWSQKKNQIIFMGRLSKEKRINIILDIWHRIKGFANWELLIIGGGEARNELEQIVRERKIQRVSFKGQVSQPQQYYRKAKVILLTSSFEGFPMCLIEAQRFGVIPLAFNISKGVHSILSHNGGIIVRNNDSKAMLTELVKIMGDEHLQGSLSKTARRKSDQYTLEEIGKQWLNLLKQ